MCISRSIRGKDLAEMSVKSGAQLRATVPLKDEDIYSLCGNGETLRVVYVCFVNVRQTEMLKVRELLTLL